MGQGCSLPGIPSRGNSAVGPWHRSAVKGAGWCWCVRVASASSEAQRSPVWRQPLASGHLYPPLATGPSPAAESCGRVGVWACGRVASPAHTGRAGRHGQEPATGSRPAGHTCATELPRLAAATGAAAPRLLEACAEAGHCPALRAWREEGAEATASATVGRRQRRRRSHSSDFTRQGLSSWAQRAAVRKQTGLRRGGWLAGLLRDRAA